MTERSGIDALADGFRAEFGPPVEERIALTVAPEDMSVRQLVPSVTFLQGEVKRLRAALEAVTVAESLRDLSKVAHAAHSSSQPSTTEEGESRG